MIKIELIENYLNNNACNISKSIDDRVKKFFTEYKEKQFGKCFFLDIDYRNVLLDLIYFRDEIIKAHLSICKQYKIKSDKFAVTSIKWYYERLKDIELESFISVLKLNDCWFHYNEKTKNSMNDYLINIVDEILNENK